MKNSIKLLVLYNCLMGCLAAQSMEVSGHITANEDWDGIVRVIGNVVVDTTAELTIHPGTHVIFGGMYNLHIYGTIRATGTSERPIEFYSQNDEWGGLWLQGNDTTRNVFDNCNFYGAKGIFNGDPENGGALSIRKTKHVRITHCTFSDNTSYRDGGAIFIFDCSPEIDSCVFKVCGAQSGGAISVQGNSSPIIHACDFAANRSQRHGGAIHIAQQGQRMEPLEIASCNIYDNVAWDSNEVLPANGGAIACNSSAIRLRNNQIANNTASFSGGGIYFQQVTPFSYNDSSVRITNNIIVTNEAGSAQYQGIGGGIWIAQTDTSVFINNTLCYNQADNSPGLHLDTGTLKAGYSIIYCNRGRGRDSVLQVGIRSDASLISFHNLIEERTDVLSNVDSVVDGRSSAAIAPQFVLVPERAGKSMLPWDIYDWRLKKSSPGIDIAMAYTSFLEEFDIAGAPRVDGDKIDCGAYEFVWLNAYWYITRSFQCVGANLRLYGDSTISNRGPISNYIWKINGEVVSDCDSSSSCKNPYHTFEEDGPHEITLIVIDPAGFMDSMSTTVDVRLSQPVAGYFYVINGPHVTFTNTSENANAWNWDFGDSSYSVERNPVHVYGSLNGLGLPDSLFPIEANYEVKLVATDSLGCPNTSIQQISICPAIGNDVIALTYPNPCKDEVNVLLSTSASNGPIRWRLWDQSGKAVRAGTASGRKFALDLVGITDGVYLLDIEDAAGNRYRSGYQTGDFLRSPKQAGIKILIDK